ncbi:3-hydroxyacyl-CoA dehydrogenase NAD-binding domain-containing protein, partial [Streptomyces carpinensis]
MGAGIAQSFATAGSSVTIVESDERSAAQACER